MGRRGDPCVANSRGAYLRAMHDDDFKKHFDLEQSEYRREEQPEPFWGHGAPEDWNLFFLQMVGTVAISVLVGYLVSGRLPYWLQHLQQ